ncbi:MAG: hypothetical protein DRP56_04000 [Planctomycetota bacterium]|nr:MAG: hypothetical protein DRP56_04000 [Planctomycetota bacterium]
MADGRMLKKRIANSKKVGKLETDTARVLYFMLLPHLDIEGRTDADPVVIKGMVCSKVETLTLKSIKSSLKDLQRVGLIDLYEHDEELYLQFTRFGDFQRLNPKREAKSHIPAPTPDKLQSDAGQAPTQVKLSLSEDKVKESKGIEISGKINTPEFLKTWDEWNQYRKDIKKKLTPLTAQKQLKKLAEFPVEQAIKTIETSITNGWQGLFPEKAGNGKSNNNNRKHSLAEQESEFGQTITD